MPCPRLFRCAARALNNRSVILRTRLKYPAHPAFAGQLERPFSTGYGTKDRAMPLNTGSFNFANSTPGMPNELQPSTICTSGAASVAHWLGVGTAHAHAGNITDASAAFDEALRLAPGSIEACETACAQLGYCYYGLREFEKSIEMLERAAQCNPGNRHVWLYRAAALHELHRYEEAIPAYEKLLADDPNDYHAKWALAQLYRITDDFSKGWAAMYHYLPRRTLRKPEWKGEDLSDKTLLVYHQHGFGDLIMYMRTLPLINAKKIILAVKPNLLRLLQSAAPGVDEVVSLSEANLDALEYDYHTNEADQLRLIDKISTAYNPIAMPYLKADQSLEKAWRERVEADGHFRVGIAWSANTAHYGGNDPRVIPLANWRPLAELPNVSFYSLQKDEASSQISDAPQLRIIDLGGDISDFADSAALMSSLDLVISIDSSPAHLAGALGRPVWTLLPNKSDWRWRRERSDHPWYPSMRLFRQGVRQSWEDLLIQVRDELAQLLRDRGNRTCQD